MRRSRLTITLSERSLNLVDRLINGRTLRNRSHAIEYAIQQYLQQKVRRAVILTGGKGTQLRPYTYEVPTALIPIKGKPLLEYTIEALKKSNIEEVILCIGYLGEQIRKYFGNGEKYGISIIYSEEKTPLQTGGALLQAKSLLPPEPFLVIHGDILTSFSYQDLIDFHQKEDSVVTVALTTTQKPGPFGQLKIHGSKLVNFYQKNKNQIVKSNLIHCGIYLCNYNLFDYFPEGKKSFLLEDIIGTLIKEKEASGFIFEEQWFDVGDQKNYELAIKQFKIERR